MSTFQGVCNFLCISCATMTTKISCNWVNKGMTSLTLKGDDASLNGKHHYLLWAFPNTNPTRHDMATDVVDNGTFNSSATSTKWFKDFQTSLPFPGLYHANPAHGREQNAHSAHTSCIMTSSKPATVGQHSFI